MFEHSFDSSIPFRFGFACAHSIVVSALNSTLSRHSKIGHTDTKKMRLRAENNHVSGGAKRPTTRTDGVPNGVKRYVLDLDLPPLERYRHIIGDHLAAMSSINEYVEAAASGLAGSTIGSFALKCVQGVMNLSNKLSLVYYSDELRAIAELSGMPLGRVVLMQLIYEASAMCTSVACPLDREGHVGHIRTMDWEMDMLKGLTIEVEARRGGETLFVGSTWAGYVGVLTGVAVRPKQARHGFSVSVNFRSVGSGTLATNLRHAITRSWPIGFLVRETLTRATGYRMCVSWLTNSKLIAPCYFTVCGAGPWEACLITRCREESIRPLQLGVTTNDEAAMASVKKTKKAQTTSCTCADADVGEKKTQKAGKQSPSPSSPAPPPCLFLVQPNMDHWSSDPDFDIMMSVARRTAVTKSLRSVLGDREICLSDARNQPIQASTPKRREGDFDSRVGKESHPSLPSAAESKPKAPREQEEYAQVSETLLWKMMENHPVTNDITIYGTLMDPREGKLDTRIPMRAPKSRRLVFV